MSSEAVVELRGLTKRYRGVTAVDGVALTVRRGEVYGFLGPNGAGKTTTLRMVVGLVRPTTGEIRVLGRRPGEAGALARVGSMIEGPAFYPFLTGRANLMVLARYAGAGSRRVDAALDAVGLGPRGGDRFSAYSLGMKQRLGVAAALLKDPDLIVLDEPTNGLDPAGMWDMRRLIRELGDSGRTVILSSHLMGEVQQVCDRVGVIDSGRMVVESTVEELRGEGELLVRAAPLDVARAALEQLEGARVVAADDDDLHVRVDESRTGEVVRALVLAGVDVQEVRRAERQLEDVFFEITRGNGHG